MKKRLCAYALTIFVSVLAVTVWPSYPSSLVDSAVRRVTVEALPERVVSLVPAATEIVQSLGAGGTVVGTTYYDSYTEGTTIVGGFLRPSIEKIEALKPDLIIVSSLHREVKERFQGRALVVEFGAHSIEDIFSNIRLMGRLFGKEDRAEDIIEGIKEELRLVRRKLEAIPEQERLRVVRLMEGPSVMVPGDDSFQLDYIRAAGGIPLLTGRKGEVVRVSREQWERFNPQVIYSCNKRSKALELIKTEKGWKDVEAVRKGRILRFPCELTCRASVNAGYFVSWLASSLYAERFAKDRLLPQRVTGSTPVDVDLQYIEKSSIVETTIGDFTNRTLLLEFKEPMRVLSTLEGWRSAVSYVGNHYIPPQRWAPAHLMGLKALREEVLDTLGIEAARSSLLFTGADMRNLAVVRESYRELTVYALVTAGVSSNALRASKDEGRFYEHGTINIILLANRRLSPRAMSRAIITATEAKTAALQTLDVRSSENPLKWQATGTGTDNIVVVEGRGAGVDSSGGHTKVGELVARAVYRGVIEAVTKQNRLTAGRNIFMRLKERGIEPSALLRTAELSPKKRAQLISRLEEVLSTPEYAAFVEAALAVSDAYGYGLIGGLEGYRLWCIRVAERLSGRPIDRLSSVVRAEELPLPVRMAFDGILTGILEGLKE